MTANLNEPDPIWCLVVHLVTAASLAAAEDLRSEAERLIAAAYAAFNLLEEMTPT